MKVALPSYWGGWLACILWGHCIWSSLVFRPHMLWSPSTQPHRHAAQGLTWKYVREGGLLVCCSSLKEYWEYCQGLGPCMGWDLLCVSGPDLQRWLLGLGAVCQTPLELVQSSLYCRVPAPGEYGLSLCIWVAWGNVENKRVWLWIISICVWACISDSKTQSYFRLSPRNLEASSQ